MEKIIIIGAGIAGLTLGILLKRKGFNVRIYEKRHTIEPIGGGLGIWPNGSRILLNLPCAESIQQLAGKIDFEYFGDAEGNTAAAINRNLFLAVNGYPILNVCRSELHQLLYETFGAENILFNTKCLNIDSEKNLIHFDNGESEQADLIVGADGIFSSIRSQLFPNTSIKYGGYIVMAGIFKLPFLERPAHNFIWGKHHYCIALPVSKNRHLIYLACSYNNSSYLTSSRQQQMELFRGWSTEVDKLLDYFNYSLTKPEFNQHYFCGRSYLMEPLQDWYKDKIVLIGDAAHPLGSILALGCSMALEDCQVLTDSLTQYANLAEALQAYQLQQKPRAAQFLALEREKIEFLTNASEENYQNFITEMGHKIMNYLKPVLYSY